MRGILSFLLVMLLAESLLFLYSYYSTEARNHYFLEEQTIHLQNLYDRKIKIKRTIENLLAQPTVSTDPYNKIEEIARRIENFESQAEQDQNYKIDIWCGYISSPSLDLMLESAKTGILAKLPPVFNANDKVIILVQGVPKEVHACSSVLIVDQATGKIGIGRTLLLIDKDLSGTVPAIGVTIVDEKNEIYDVDYLG